MEEIEVPSFFICPISLQIMKDPVTLPTGITYDRDSIEKWLFTNKNNSCPVTKQVVTDVELTPNHTLRRLIQSWCTLNASYGIERIPTPKPPINKSHIVKLLRDARSPHQQVALLKKLRAIAVENDANKRCMESAGVVEFLASVINKFNCLSIEEVESISRPGDEAMSILYSLQLSEFGLKILNKNSQFIDSLTGIMKCGSYESRAYAVMLLNSMVEVADPLQLLSSKPDLFGEIVQVLQDRISKQASKASLQLLLGLSPWGRNRVRIVESNAVSVLIEILLDSTDRRSNELALTLLEVLCQCAEGRAALLKHAAGLAVVSKKILRVSQVGSDRAVRILLSVCRFCGTSSVVQEMLQLGVVGKLCLVLQVDCGNKTKEKTIEILRLHAKVWKNSSCIPPSLISSYPI